MSDPQLDRIEGLLKEVHQRQQEKVIPLIEKHEACLFGPDGTTGIASWVNAFKEHIHSHWRRWENITAPILVGVLVFMLSKYIK